MSTHPGTNHSSTTSVNMAGDLVCNSGYLLDHHRPTPPPKEFLRQGPGVSVSKTTKLSPNPESLDVGFRKTTYL